MNIFRALIVNGALMLFISLQGCAHFPKADVQQEQPLLGAEYPVRWAPNPPNLSPVTPCTHSEDEV
jgi:hypothetical protein